MKFDEWWNASYPSFSPAERAIARCAWNAGQEALLEDHAKTKAERAALLQKLQDFQASAEKQREQQLLEDFNIDRDL